MPKIGSLKIATLLILALLASACGGSFGPPPECTEGLGGTADEAKFAQYFSSVELVSQNTGQPGELHDPGASFPVSEPLVIKISSVGDVTVRACVQFFNGNQIAFDQSFTFTPGENEITLGAFPDAGNYVVRMIVDGVLVKNFPFTLQ